MNDKNIQNSARLIGRRIRTERLRRQKTQEEFSRLIGISPSYLGALERGSRPISRNVMNILHERLGISYDYLMEGYISHEFPLQNTVQEPGGYHVRRDISFMLSSCNTEEARECYDLLHAYLTHIRSRQHSRDDNLFKESESKS